MYKQCNVVMLTTNEKANITLNAEENLNLHTPMKKGDIYVKQEFYIISDDKIKEGDWYLNIFDNTITLANINSDHTQYACKKIIATTDKSLLVDYKGYEYETAREYEAKVYLPQLSTEFIDEYTTEYNNRNIITDVLVEYNEVIDDVSVKQAMTIGMNIKDMGTISILKIDKNNYITIKPVKTIKVLKTISLHREIDSSPLKTHSIMNELTSEVNDIYIGSINDSTKEIVNITYMIHNDIVYCILTYSITK